jgi:hypothetical protein
MTDLRGFRIFSVARVLGIAMLSFAALTTQASGISLSTLVGGGPVPSGGLVFSNFEIQINGDLSTDLSSYDIAFSGSGLRLTGPLSGADGETGSVFLAYTVTATGSNDVSGASMLASNVASGPGAQAAVDAVLTDNGSSMTLAVLSTFDTGGVPGDAVTAASGSFAPSTDLRVASTILIDSAIVGGGFGGSARITAVEQQFVVTPEAETAALLTLGLLGLATAGRNRRPKRGGPLGHLA